MAERPRDGIKNDAPKDVPKSTDKSGKLPPPREDTQATSSGKVPNSASQTASKATGKSHRTAEKTTRTTSTASKKTPGKTPPPNDANQRLDRIEQAIEAQNERNQQFQHSILATLSGLIPDEDDDCSSVASAMSTGGILQASAPSVDHPISDEEDAQRVSDDNPPGQSDTVTLVTEPKQDECKPDLGFAAQFAMDIDEGTPIGDDIVKALGHVMTYKLEESKLKEAMERHKCPSNCDCLQVPMVNPQIWKDIPSKSKTVDLKLQRVEKPLVKGLIAISKFVGQGKLNQDGIDGFTLVANAAFELNCLRREMLKPDISPQFHNLCKPQVYDNSCQKEEPGVLLPSLWR